MDSVSRSRVHPGGTAVLVLLGLVATGVPTRGASYSIYEIQHTADPQGRSLLEGQVVDCLGGIVTHKYEGGKPKLTIQDPNYASGWGAIQVKDWLGGAPLFHGASVGDWVMLSNVYVEESRGNTTLQCFAANNPVLITISRDNPLPEPLIVAIGKMASPVRDSLGDWYAQSHVAEKYEHMRVRVRRVAVVEKDLGKAADNYVLRDVTGPNDPASTCWAADYLNADAEGDYHPYIQVGQSFCSVDGIVEQYTDRSEGWDYYQLVTTRTESFLVSQVYDLDGDCDVDFVDFSAVAALWLNDCRLEPSACDGDDPTGGNIVSIDDLARFADRWLDGRAAMDPELGQAESGETNDGQP